jgi:hypothetical protein
MIKNEARYTRAGSYTYQLRSHPTYYFEAGRSDSGQALWGFLAGGAYVLHFDGSGRLLRVEQKDLPGAVVRGAMPEMLRDLSFRVRSELALTDEPISIRRFWLRELNAGIEDLGDDLKEFADSPASFQGEELAEMTDALEQWLSGGMYVLWWEQPFEVNEAGEVETS